MTIDIIGAGICGLTTAIALERKGFKPRIYEQAKELKPLGAGIILASNAMQVYRDLGLADELKSYGIPLTALNITDASLNLISKIDLDYFKSKYDLQSLAIHRGKLQEVLLDHLKTTEIHLDHKLTELSKKENAYLMKFENGKALKSSLLLGADGIYSKVRKSISPQSKIRTMQQICWRGVTNFDLPDIYKNKLTEAWGAGDRFAFVPLNKNQIYWYALKSFEQDRNEFTKKQIQTYFKDYPPIVKDIINATPLDTLHTSVIEDLKPIRHWHDEFVCLLGDAAHATTPNMGQGACQSIEDAYVIAECLEQFKDSKAFNTFEELRMSTAHQVVHRSWTIGKISHWRHPLAAFLRNGLLRIIPEKVNIIQLERLFQLKKAN